MNKLAPFLTALQFLTRIPVPKFLHVDWSDKNTGLSQAYYPVIGLLIGFILYICSQLLMTGLANTLLVSGILVLVWVIITGALHIDGLADTMDAWVGGYGDQNKTLKIMCDPQSGPIAVVAVVMVLLIKVIALSEVIADTTLMILFIPMLARLIIPFYFLTTLYLREEGIASAISENQNRVMIGIIGAICLMVFIILFGLFSVKLFIAFLVFNFLLRLLLVARFSGITGDIAGLIIEVNEVFLLVMAIILI